MQVPEQQEENKFVSPLMYIGVFIFAAPVITRIFGFNLWGWISGFGVIIIVLGAAHTIIKRI